MRCSSIAALLCLLVVSCRPSAGSHNSVLVYCTPDALPHARVLMRLAKAHGMKRKVTLAPMRPSDILAALSGIKSGDFVLCIGNGLEKKLADQSLVRGKPASQALGVCLVSRTPMQLADAGLPGKHLGTGKSQGPLAKTAEKALPESTRAPVAKNVVHRDNRSDGLVRLVRLGTLDAAFVWDSPPPAPDLPTLTLGKAAASCPLNLIPLSCSHLPQADRQALLTLWQSEETSQALASKENQPEPPAK